MPKPNLLFIFTDEQRADTLRCYGDNQIQAPHLNALAEESFVFERAYCTQPICTPARSSIMSGLYPHTTGCTANGIPLPAETKTLAELAPEGYRCGYFGKWHLGDEIIAQHGFEEWVSIEDFYRSQYSQDSYRSQFSDYWHFLVNNGFEPGLESAGAKVFARRWAAELPVPYTKASFLGQQAARFIQNNREQPFVLYVNFLEPHMPFTGPLNDLYSPDELVVGPRFLQPPPPNASLLTQGLAGYYAQATYEGLDLSDEESWRRLRANYQGLVTLVDGAVGTILQALEESGQAGNTVVVFTSDHGDMMGDHRLLKKGLMYEESARIPLLMRVPWLGREQRLIHGNVSQIDLVPTLLDLLDAPIPEFLQGESRVPVLQGAATLAGNDVVIEWHGAGGRPGTLDEQSRQLVEAAGKSWDEIVGGPWRTLVSADGWKLNLSPVDRPELYDLNHDPYETDNRYTDPNQQERVQDLIGRLRRWQARTADSMPLPAV